MAKASSRNYTRERLNEDPQRVKDRAKRNSARRELMREGVVRKGDGKVVDHKNPLSRGGSTNRSNLRPQSEKSSNRQGGNLQPKSAKAKGGLR
tara:strand:+ start:1341 stop:1619 length:279 start_codon:yes stop_codon:yes gene_type:complete